MKIEYYTADWCVPCKQFYPVVESLCKENNIELVKVDITEKPYLAKDLNIKGVPTLIVKDNNEKIIATRVGSSTKEALDAFLAGCNNG